MVKVLTNSSRFFSRRTVVFDALRCADRVERARDDLGGTCLVLLIAEPVLEQLGIREDHAELIVQLMEQGVQIGVWHLCASAQVAVGPRLDWRQLGSSPQGVGKDSDGATGGPDVLDLSARHPVVDGSATHADKFTCTRNGDCLTLDGIHIRLKLSAGASNSYRPPRCVKMSSAS